MNEWVEGRTRRWAIAAVLVGLVLSIALELYEEPDLSAGQIALELVGILPGVLTSVGVVLLFRISSRQRGEQLTLMRDLELARAQGQRWRSEARTYLNGLGDAIERQFSLWHLTEAESEVALLLLKGLSLKEVAQVRATSERTVRAQARSLYGKSGLTGRAALSAFFLEDLLAPIESIEQRD